MYSDEHLIDPMSKFFVFAIAAIIATNGTASDNTQKYPETPVVNLSKLEPGILISILWNNFPVFVLKRTPEQINKLKTISTKKLGEVENCDNCNLIYRSVFPEYLVIYGYNPISGCQLTYISSSATESKGSDENSGFIDKCLNIKYDISGRPISNLNAKDLPIPPHSFIGTEQVMIGKKGSKI